MPVVVLAAVFLAVPLVLVALVVSVAAEVLALRARPTFFVLAFALRASTAFGRAIAFPPFTVQIG
ncbi:hypothetical protein H6F86_26615 [Phormidium sp. FACHB-592]|uniref:Secreted peptide n=1 Tax=Stenomitos frigidus AS-A4 TaxID=2933935 RepID=A0ABV0KPJ3_9CYAN|nr:hypothetical protein [Phormidium sp. FACHB-592]MBD2077390.1 hypothetical protein [Phormidium sp. FACHB-592]